jgi:hypothetical protein
MNRDIAARLEEAAWLLRDQGADPYRVNAYLRAAATVRLAMKQVVVAVKGTDRLVDSSLRCSEAAEPDSGGNAMTGELSR